MAQTTILQLAFLLYAASTVGAIRCFECQDIPHPSDCRTVTDCPDDSECYTEQVATSGGLLLFQTGCRGTQRCAATKRDAARSVDGDLQTCSECCSDDYCNLKGCHQQTIPKDQRGLLCYNCHGQEGHKGCRTITECDLALVCSIENKKYSQGEYVTKCREKAQCDAVAKMTVYQQAQVTNGNILQNELPYCCTEDFCNVDSSPPYRRVDGQWSPWSGFTSCTFTCGPAAMKARTRYCNNPPPSPNGLNCTGDSIDFQMCSVPTSC